MEDMRNKVPRTTQGGKQSRRQSVLGCLLVFCIKKTRHRTHTLSEQLIRAIRAGPSSVAVRVDNVKCYRVITVNKRNGKSQSWEILGSAGTVKKPPRVNIELCGVCNANFRLTPKSCNNFGWIFLSYGNSNSCFESKTINTNTIYIVQMVFFSMHTVKTPCSSFQFQDKEYLITVCVIYSNVFTRELAQGKYSFRNEF